LFALANYYRRWIQYYSKVSKTLLDLFNEKVAQDWNAPFHQAFGELKSKLSLPPGLKFTKFYKSFEVHTGSHDFAIGGLLMQV
jgi:hypothetical protein